MTATTTTDDVHDIRHGYNLADLNQIAHAAVRRGARSGIVPAGELYEAAWSAIAETLVTATERPRPYDLIGAGMDAIGAAIWAGERAHGWDRERRDIRPSFATFWTGLGAPTPSPEARIVDRTALWQIWPTLPDGQRAALLALATCGDYQTAADSLGISYAALHDRIRGARRAFLAAWHEHETPSTVWATDRRRWRHGQPVQRRRLTDHATIRARRKKAGAA